MLPAPPRTPPVVDEPGVIVRTFVPRPATRAFSTALVPCVSVTTEITAATPTITPRIVSSDRSLLAQSAPSALRTLELSISPRWRWTGCPLSRVCRWRWPAALSCCGAGARRSDVVIRTPPPATTALQSRGSLRVGYQKARWRRPVAHAPGCRERSRRRGKRSDAGHRRRYLAHASPAPPLAPPC